MKLSIRASLIWINLLVTTTILWLALSFLTAAYVQRRDATLLIETVQQNEQLFETVYRFSIERNHYIAMLGERQVQDHHAIAEVIDYTSTTRSLVEKQRVTKENLLQRKALTRRLVYPTDFLTSRLQELDNHQDNLAVYQDYANRQLVLSKADRDQNINSILLEAYNDTIELLIQINTYIQIQPRKQLVNFSDLEQLQKSVLDNSHHSLLQTGLLTSALAHSLPYDATLQQDLLVIEDSLAQSRRRINRYFHKNSHDTHIRQEVETAFAYNDFNYDMAKTRLESALRQPELTHMNNDQWTTVVSRQVDNFWALSKAINQKLRSLAQEWHRQATKKLMIDAAVVFICMLVALISYGITRKIRYQSNHDDSTGLPNRSFFKSHLSKEISNLGSHEKLGIIYLDINKLKSINDTFGQDIGDELIDIISKRLATFCGKDRFLARMGGDEFAIVHKTCPGEQPIMDFTNQLMDRVNQETTVRGQRITSTASAGISIYQDDGVGVDELIRMADVALFEAKNSRQSRIIRYDKDTANHYHQRVQTEIELTKAIELKQLELHYQPKTCVESGATQHLEALLRWNHPTRGLVPPSDFIPIAEEANLLHAIGSWVLKETCRQISTWKQYGLSDLTVAVNISAQQFQDENFIRTVLDPLDQYQVERHHLELEITESIMMTDIERVITILKELKNEGIGIAIDDFGTGYSSLQYLQNLPLNTIKIDRTFVSDLDHREASDSLANTIVQLAKHLGLKTVAEGVETTEQDTKIRSLGVDFIQGYYYSKPISAAEVPATLSRISSMVALPRAA